MLNRRQIQSTYVWRVIDGLLLIAAFFVAFQIRRGVRLPLVGEPIPVDLASHIWLLAIAVPLLWGLTQRPPRVGEHGSLPEIRGLIVAFVYLGLLLGTVIFLFQAKTYSRAVFFLFLAGGFLTLAGARLVIRAVRSRRTFGDPRREHVLIVGSGPEAFALRRRLEDSSRHHIEIVGHVPIPGVSSDRDESGAADSLDDFMRIVEDEVVDHVVFVIPPSRLTACQPHIAWCDEVGVTVHVQADFLRDLVSKTYPSDFDGIPMLTLASTPHDAGALLIKRVVDVIGSAAALIVLAPVMLIIAALVKLTSRGPLLFSQDRVGLNGRSFRLYKFRSMYRDAEAHRRHYDSLNEMDGPVFKIERDPRVTPVGRWLRKFSLDELPQFWNVLRGDMSLVGPRPPLASEVAQYERWQRRRLSMKPGITCLWQVRGRNEIRFKDWMRLDLQYIDQWSLLLDFKILLWTFPAVVLARGAR